MVHSYCGSPPDPGALGARFNLDPILIVALLVIAGLHIAALRRSDMQWRLALSGWVIAALAFLSPLCALSVALFSARVGQHMILTLAAAPLIAAAGPWRMRAMPAALAFFAALWFWHMPAPYAATYRSTPIYWTMHLSLFGSAIGLWTALLHVSRAQSVPALAAGFATSVHMGLLGAFLTLATRPMFEPHYFTTTAWNLTPLQDQQLGGVFMWVPGIFLFLWVALRSAHLGWRKLEGTPA
ncbi:MULTISPECIES: cytochrome c oxidase assembly protein [unclassified Sphingomonas]|uniref:cytochrome c oxidase assembly protein n=1 Tax=unclassified Sphingomonas TaxID=196159 RepID=UPI0006F62F27|nr:MULTISPECIES: cytochrome c oxidase assembly protein [unclassified Sphingomonas]KQX17662.1 hypothetical protein ASD17_18205 [Sphingomonas sp. Root1294]KQY70588.1 hypothetical protein ASD39_22105 [Sphingomonas sp. Root50]KRB91922.1 hypothetical protein ASE22_08205 [Sphingomonas sp. Root720]